MTEQPSTNSQPSMDDILASIRRIIDDEEVATPPVHLVEKPEETQTSFDIDDEAAALALAEYDAAMAADAEETIFPQRDGALWRRVAGHPLSEGETDPLAAEDTLELTETIDDDSQLNDLLESTVADGGHLSEVTGESSPASDDSSTLGIGAMTAAGVGAAGLAGGSLMDRIAGRAAQNDMDRSAPVDDDDDDEVLDLVRSVEPDELAPGNPRYDSDDLPPPIFERVELDDHGSSDLELWPPFRNCRAITLMCLLAVRTQEMRESARSMIASTIQMKSTSNRQKFRRITARHRAVKRPELAMKALQRKMRWRLLAGWFAMRCAVNCLPCRITVHQML